MADRSGYIGRAPGDSSVIIARQTFEPTGIQTDFTFASGYTPGYIDVYLNGSRLIVASDYTATDGSVVGLTTNALNGDVLECVAYKAFNLGSVKEANGNFDVGNDLTVAGNLNVTGDITYDEVVGRNLNISGIATVATLGVSVATTSKDLLVTGIATVATLEVGSNIKLGNAGVVTATSFSGSGANLTGISAGLTTDAYRNTSGGDRKSVV